MKEIEETLRNSIAELKKELSVNMYLIGKTSTKGTDSYKTYTVDIGGEIPRYFRDIIRNKLEELMKDNELKYRKFFDRNSSGNEIRMISINDVSAFNSILKDIDEFADLPPFKGIDELDIWAYAIEINFSGDKLIYFRKYSASRIMSKKRITTVFYRNKLDKVKGDVLTFDDFIDCVYYKRLVSILILDKEKFENIFNFNEFYRKESENALNSLSDIIKMDPGIILGASMKRRLSLMKKITELSKSGMLDKETIGNLIKTKYFEKHKKELPEIMMYDIVNNKIKVNDIKSLDAFLDTCAENYLKGLASENKYRTERKEKVSP